MTYRIEAAKTLSDLIEGFWTTRLIGTAVALGIPEHLCSGPRSSEQLAAACKADRPSLVRVLRALQALGICRLRPDGHFELTSMGGLLCTNAEGSMRGRALFASTMMWEIFGDLDAVVRSGRPTEKVPTGRVGFAGMRDDPRVSGMHWSMVESSLRVVEAVMQIHDFGCFARLLDVGGGYGGALSTILQRHPRSTGDVLDLAYLGDAACGYLSRAGLAGRARFLEGDFFDSVPAGYDCYLLKYVIHDWDDAHARDILRSCAVAAATDSEVVLLERVLPPTFDETSKALAEVDVAMMITGGKERTAVEYDALLNSAGLRMLSMQPTATGCSLIRAIRKN